MKKHKLNQKKSLLVLVIFLLGLGLLFVSLKNTPATADYEDVVFIRNIEKSGFDYVVTIDQASNLLPEDGEDASGREVNGIESLIVASGAKIWLLEENGSVSMGDLSAKFESDPTYVGKVFSVGVKGEEIVSIKEEDL